MNTVATKVRAIVHRTRGSAHGPITRLVSPGDLGELLKPFVFLDLVDHDGAPFNGSLHPHSGIATLTYIMEGALKFELEGREVVVRKGEVLHIPSNVPHRAVALEDTLDLDIFAPIREDWLTKNDSYLRKGETEKD